MFNVKLTCCSYFKEKLSDVVGDDDVIVIAGNSPAFRAIVISLTILLGALTGAILLCQFVVYLYQRIVTGNRTEDKQGNFWPLSHLYSVGWLVDSILRLPVGNYKVFMAYLICSSNLPQLVRALHPVSQAPRLSH